MTKRLFVQLIIKSTILEYGRGGQVTAPTKKHYQMVFDVAHGKMTVDTAVNMLQRLGDAASKEPGNTARAFTLNVDGTFSPTAAPHLVLGIEDVEM